MKIIFLNRFFFPDHSATSQLLSELAFDLASRRHRTIVITSRQKIDDPNAGLPRFEQINGVHVHRVWTTCSARGSLLGRAFDYLTFYLFAGWLLFCLCRREDLVVAKTDPPLISVIAAIVVKIRGARLVNWLHDLFPEVAVRLGVHVFSGWPARFLVALRNWSLNSAQENVVLGRGMAQVLCSENVEAARIKIVHNWCYGKAIRPLPHEKNNLRKFWNLDNLFVVMYSGNLGRAHDFYAIVQAADLLRKRSGIKFLIVGDGVQKAWLQAEVKSRGLSNVQFDGYQDSGRLGESLSAGDVHLISLLPELEGLIVPSKFYGIAAVGRPTLFIGSSEGETARILEEAKCGIQVEPRDGKALALNIERLIENPELRKAMGRAARELFEQRYDQPIALEGWRKVLGV